MSTPSPALATILTRRIVFFAVLAMLVQLAVVFSDYYWNVGELSRLFVEQETERLASGIGNNGGEPTYQLPAGLKDRYGKPDTGYVARIRNADGRVIFASCDNECERHFLPADIRPPDFWLRTVTPGKPLTLVGGRAFAINGKSYFVDVASMGDPENVVSNVFWNEVREHMIVPMSILLVLVLGATLLSVHWALRPVHAAAIAADAIDPMDARSHLSVKGMPLEIAHLAEAVNRAFQRVGELMKSQKLLTTGIAHEVRTPLAAIKLELSRIDHPRARKAEADLDELAAFVGQLTALARLDSFDHGMFANVDLVQICTEVVEQLAPWVYQSDHTLELQLQTETTIVLGVETLLKDSIRNLIENAVKHTPPGTDIVVRVIADGLQVEDLNLANCAKDRLFPGSGDGMGIGLKIVQRIAALHGATFKQQQSRSGRLAEITFSKTAPYRAPETW
ncbi:ATP-binding protein [Rhizobium leucaenae]|uniref:sensor histidine kinase n=1 Tax=Rhizobium leucaenae TaxID=29450 RepID=UPI0007EE3E78|nr:signal transduction histidine kinase [Rhizobium leucaenae]